ncbi:unnamed protein product [Penicillium salamii]|uniref:Zn(2)-C6 fungal-type domain-containing protein n=1 Tax=Penicillium salamii TaxID=1612424 RepID=A0A9W4NKB3_9EURO|nr:unnamed protein product [Penicillium salamii]
MSTKPKHFSRPLLRVRTGCLSCRARKKKCDEEKPICMGCTRNRLQCRWPDDRSRRPLPTPIDGPQSPSDKDVESTTTSNRGESVTREQDCGAQSAPGLGCAFNSDTPEEFESHTRGDLDWQRSDLDFEPSSLNDFNSGPEEAMESPGWLVRESLHTLNEMIPASPGLMPQLDHNRFSLFGHYIQKTAISMANGATESNPFLVLLIPLTVSSELVLESILVQSSAHRAVHTPELGRSEALVLYNKSLRSLWSAIDKITTQKDKEVLGLIVSMLIICFTETARGDVTGSIFYHLQATSSLLPNALIKLKGVLPKDLRNFLVEYYIYTATLSLISMDGELMPLLKVCSGLLDEGQQLVESGYVGNLCGCWLELLLLIPRVFHLGYEWRKKTSPEAMAERVTTFALIQLQLARWEPSVDVPHDVALVGNVFKQALMVYLYGILGEPTLDESSIHAISMQEAVMQAMHYLEELPPSNQINTSLCWPLAVIGASVIYPEQQECIRRRLDVMAERIGLGNIHKTRDLLEYMWSQERRGPWEIPEAMQAAQIWISFA